MNQVTLLGRLTKDPEEVKGSKNKKSYSKFTLAVPRVKKDETDFINCVAFEKTGELIAKYVKKGNRLLVEGNLNVSTIKDKEDNYKSFTTVIVNKISFIDSANNKTEEKEENQEELPF